MRGERKSTRGGSTALRRNRTLEHCTAYRAWLNNTGAAQQRTVSVYPDGGRFPPDSVTVFAAPAGHQGPPPNAANATKVSPDGDAVAKTVPNNGAVFVHYARPEGGGPDAVDAVIDDGPV